MKDRLVTLIGGGGFLGRYVAQELLCGRRAGAHRAARSARRLVPEAARRARPDPVRRGRRHASPIRSRARSQGSDRGGQSGRHFRRERCAPCTSMAPRNVAEAARRGGVEALVHVSAIGADPGIAFALMAAPRPRARRRCARRSRPRRSCAPRSCSGARTQFVNRFAGMIAECAGRAGAARPGREVPAGLCRRCRAGGGAAAGRSRRAWRPRL